MKIIYLDCSMGASGDMLMGALFSLLQEEQKENFLRRMNALQLPGVSVSAESSENGGIAGIKMHVKIHGTEEGIEPTAHVHGHMHADSHGHHTGVGDHDHEYADMHTHDREHAGTHTHTHGHADGQEHDRHTGVRDYDHEHADMHTHAHGHADDHGHDHHTGAGDHDHGHADMHTHDREHAGTHTHTHGHADGHSHNHDIDNEDYDHADSHRHEHRADMPAHDHVHADEHGQDPSHAATGDHVHDPAHAHSHGHHHHDHTHAHTSMKDIGEIVGSLDLPYAVRESILDAFSRVAQAESLAHGKPVDQIHFHEVGQMDAIADVTGVSLLMEMLKPDRVIVSPVHVGSGTVMCAHGEMPVPAPATAAILRGVPVYSDGLKGELCTPTGAALLKTFADRFMEMPAMTVDSVGYGLGSRNFEGRANCLRAFRGEMPEDTVLEVPDATPENEKGREAALEDRARDAVSQLVDSLELQLSELDRASLLFNPDILSEMENPCFDSGEWMTWENSEPVLEARTEAASLHSETEAENRAGDSSRMPLEQPNTENRNVLSETVKIPDPGTGTMIAKIECNIDDMTPEALAYAKEILFREGARDVYSTAIHMKKNRDGVLLSVICDEADVERMSGLLFRHTTTIGVRIQHMERRVLARRMQKVSTPYGWISVKIAEGFGVCRMKPESDEVARAASEAGVSYEEVFRAAMRAAEQMIS